MKATRNGNTVEISFKYDLRLISLIKTFPGRQFNVKTKSWHIPLTGSLPVIAQLRQQGFEIDPELMKSVVEDDRKACEAVGLAMMDDTEFESPLPLRDYQRVGSAFLYRIGSGLLADEPGVGKTLQCLAVAEKARAKKVLIFTPASVKWQFRDEIQKFIPSDRRTVVIHGSARKRAELWADEDQRFYVANYEQLLRDFDHINQREWDLIVADEATKISNSTAKQSKFIKKLRAKRRIAMTGTPISNRANEVWNILDFCVPGALGNYWSFVERYCLKNQWGGVFGYRNMDELRDRIKRYMIRRLKSDVLTELPEKIVTDVPFPLSEEEKKFYDRLKKELLFEIQKTDISKLNTPMSIQFTLVKMTRLRQVADSMELLGENVKSSKMEVLKELLTEFQDNDQKIIIFSEFSEMCKILKRELDEWNPLMIIGETNAKERGEVVEKFNTDPTSRLLLMSSAGAFGLNLQSASVIIHYDQAWSLGKMSQRSGRAHRMGQKRVVLEYHLLAEKTVDHYIKKMLHDKADLSREVLGDIPITIGQIQEMLL